MVKLIKITYFVFVFLLLLVMIDDIASEQFRNIFSLIYIILTGTGGYLLLMKKYSKKKEA